MSSLTANREVPLTSPSFNFSEIRATILDVVDGKVKTVGVAYSAPALLVRNCYSFVIPRSWYWTELAQATVHMQCRGY